LALPLSAARFRIPALPPFMSQPFVWNVDPVLAHIGGASVRYYGICFGLALLTGFAIWNHRVRRFGESAVFAERWLWYGVAGVVIGGRIGHCFFYQPRTYLANPLRVLRIWEGGVSSHGVALGLAIALWLFARRHHVTWTKLGDYFAPAVALAVNWIRVGNFFNSEVLGSPSTAPWAVVFARIDTVPRHPVQLYEIGNGILTWLVLREVERRNIRPIGSGLIAGTFLLVYFTLRIIAEHFKQFYIEQWRTMSPFSDVERLVGFPIHTGQWLSVIPVLAGAFLVARALRQPAPPVSSAHPTVSPAYASPSAT
jgi:phosphatidylglycerol:prolipoprotein diacylglycerol transferase